MVRDNYSLPKEGTLAKEYKYHRKLSLKRISIIFGVISLIVIVFVGNIYRSTMKIKDTHDKLLRLQLLNNIILKADKDAAEQLSRELIAGDWYNSPISKDAAIPQIISNFITYVQIDELIPFLEQVKIADQNLSQIESEIDKFYLEKKMSEARAIFSGDDYSYWKREYSNNIEQIFSITYNELSALLQKHNSQINYAIVMLFVLLPILLVSYKIIRKFSNESIQLSNVIVASREQFELAVQGPQDGLWDWIDMSDEKMMWWSPGLYELLGYKVNEIESSDSTFRKLLHPEDFNGWINAVKLHLENKIPYDLEYRLKRKSGDYRWFNSRGQAVWDDNGHPLRMAGSLRDIHDRKMAEEDLKKSEEKYRSLVDINPDVIFQLNDKGTIIYISPRITDFTGYLPDELIGKNISEIIHQSDHDKIIKICGKRTGKRTVKGLELKLVRKKRRKHIETRYVDINSTGVYENGYSGDGKIESRGKATKFFGTQGTITDISGRVKAEADLYEIGERFRSVFEKSALGISMSHKSGKFIAVNEKLCNMLGYTEEELLKLTVNDITYPEDFKEYKKNIIKLFKGKIESIQREKRYVKKDGKLIWISVNLSGVEDKDGNFFYFISIIEDITDKKRDRDQIFRLSNAVENAEDLVLMTDISGKIEYVNSAFEYVTGYTKDEVMGKTPNILKSGKMSNDFYKTLWKTILSGKNYQGTIINKKKNGDLYYFEQTIVPLKDDSEKVVNFVSTGRDITGKMNAEKEKSLLEQQFFQAQKMESIGRLAGGIAHDFNNILSAMLVSAEGLQFQFDKDSPEGFKTDIIIQGVLRASELTKQLLGFARGGKYNPIPMNINSIIKGAIKVSETIFKKNTMLIYDFDKNVDTIEADESQMDQVFTNIIINANDAMPKGGKLTFKTENVNVDENDIIAFKYLQKSGHYVKISVSDTGTGMSQETMDKIFEPFFTTKSKDKGTGLGLATVYGIIKNHGGSVFAQSELGVGSTFIIYFPASGKKIAKKECEDKKIKKSKGTILVVDDEEHVRLSTGMLLDSIGYKTLYAEDGKEAVKIYKKNKGEIALVLLDMLMPKMSGKETFRALKKIKYDVKTVIFSGYSIDIKVKDILSEGVSAYIQKPFRAHDLSEIIYDILN